MLATTTRWTPEMAEAATAWWAAKVVIPKFDNGDPASGIAAAMAGMLAASVAPDTTAAALFRDRLKELILSEQPRDLSTDYDPDILLGSAASAAGISNHSFPRKTVMWAKDGAVIVRYGYAAPVETIYPAGAS